jgi:serine-type D-Ala-D-Ala carboxypeptidase/endopeptidase (penicillin-binding protein 4)
MRVLALMLTLVTSAWGTDLSARLDKALQAVPTGGEAGVAVFDLDAGAWLYQSNATRPLALASVTKLLVTVAAYAELGPQFQFSTRVVSLGPVQPEALPGIGVIGGGDPCFDGHFYDDEPDRAFLQWAEHLRRAGIKRIDGNIVIDSGLFAGAIRPGTYPQDADNQQRWYSAPASAFAWNDNCIEVRVVPTVPGHPAEVQVRPQSSRIQVRNLTRTVSGTSEGRSSMTRDPAANTVTVSGNYTKTTAWFPLAIATDPDLLAGDHLKRMLEQSGIVVSGDVTAGAVDPRAGPLLVDMRHDLQPAVALMNQHSQNFYAEQLLRMVGAHRSSQGSIRGGCAAALDVL